MTPPELMKVPSLYYCLHNISITENTQMPGKYVLLKALREKGVFYTQFRFGIDYTKNTKGEISFKVIGYAGSEAEAQNKLVKLGVA